MTADPYGPLAAFYERVFDPRNGDAGFYAALARREGGPVLDAGCGTGRVARAIAAQGIAVTGYDRSAAMLAEAGRLASAAGPRLSFHRAELESPPGGPFALVVCAADTFLHCVDQAQQLAVLAGWRAVTRPGGALALDVTLPAGPWADWEEGERPWQPLAVWDEADGLRREVSLRWRAEPWRQGRRAWARIEEWTAGGPVRRHEVEVALRLVTGGELRLLLERTGWRVEAEYGDFDAGALGPGSERLVVVARAAG